jgi:hypothetical protein
MAHDQQALELAARSCTRRRGLVTALDHERTLSTNHEICRRSLLCETDLEELCRNVGALSRHSESEAFTDDDKPLEREDGLLLLRLAVDFVLN